MAEVERANLTGKRNSDPPLPVLTLIRSLTHRNPDPEELVAVDPAIYADVLKWYEWNFNNSGEPKWLPLVSAAHPDYQHVYLCGHCITPSPLAASAAQ